MEDIIYIPNSVSGVFCILLFFFTASCIYIRAVYIAAYTIIAVILLAYNTVPSVAIDYRCGV